MTEEMQKAINGKEKHKVLMAKSGSGKSTTLVEYVKCHRNKNILFIVYNKELQIEFSGRLKKAGLYNCKVATIHSIAYREWLSKGMGKKQLVNVSLLEMKQLLKKKMEYADLSKVKFYFDRFLSSNRQTPFDLDEIEAGDKRYFKDVDKLWKYFVGDSTSMPHNVYLKWYQLQNIPFECDTLLCDEVNDFNELMYGLVIQNMDKEIFCVGDDLQNIASFNHTIDTLNILINKHGFKRYDLTMSFRISETVANLASRFLSYMYGESIFFNGCKDTKIGFLNLRQATKENQIHLLCRNRLGALNEILELLDSEPDKKIYFVGGLDSFGIKEMERLLSYKGNIYIGGIKYHISELRRMLNDGLIDAEIQKIVNIYNFANKNEDCISILKHSEVTKRELADIICQTAHSSKGGTYTNVKFGNDFPKIEELREDYQKTKGEEYYNSLIRSEINLIYVALTRATGIVDIGNVLHKNDLRTTDVKEKYEEMTRGMYIK